MKFLFNYINNIILKYGEESKMYRENSIIYKNKSTQYERELEEVVIEKEPKITNTNIGKNMRLRETNNEDWIVV